MRTLSPRHRQLLALGGLTCVFIVALAPIGAKPPAETAASASPPSPSSRPIDEVLLVRVLDARGRTLLKQSLPLDPMGMVSLSGEEVVVRGLEGPRLVERVRSVILRGYPGARRIHARLVAGIVVHTRGPGGRGRRGFPTGPKVVPRGTTLAGLFEILPLGQGSDPRRVTHIRGGVGGIHDLIEAAARRDAPARRLTLAEGDWIVVAPYEREPVLCGPHVFGAVERPGRAPASARRLGRVLAGAAPRVGSCWVYVLSGWDRATALRRYRLDEGRLSGGDQLVEVTSESVVVVGGERVPAAVTELLALLMPIGGEPRLGRRAPRSPGT